MLKKLVSKNKKKNVNLDYELQMVGEHELTLNRMDNYWKVKEIIGDGADHICFLSMRFKICPVKELMSYMSLFEALATYTIKINRVADDTIDITAPIYAFKSLVKRELKDYDELLNFLIISVNMILDENNSETYIPTNNISPELLQPVNNKRECLLVNKCEESSMYIFRIDDHEVYEFIQNQYGFNVKTINNCNLVSIWYLKECYDEITKRAEEAEFSNSISKRILESFISQLYDFLPKEKQFNDEGQEIPDFSDIDEVIE